MDSSVLHVLSNGILPMEEVLKRFKMIEPFVNCLHLREKERSMEQLKVWVSTLLAEGIPRHKLIINSYFQLVVEFGLKGVHLPESNHSIKQLREAYPGLVIGCSVHSLEAGIVREKEGANYVYFGNIFETTCKPGKVGAGVSKLQELASTLTIPVIGIGGITSENIGQILDGGSKGAAIMSPVMNAKDPVKVIKEYRKSMEVY